MNKPYIVCHMMTSVDGRIDCAMTEQLAGVEDYYRTLDSFGAPSRVSGRVTAMLEMACAGEFKSEKHDPVMKETFYMATSADGYEIVADTRGTLLWDGYNDEGRPLLILMSEKAGKEYLAYLERLHISYIVCGAEHIDLARACELLKSEFGVSRMAVVGGGHINAGFLAAGLLDEVSILVGSGIDGRKGMSAVFDGLPQNRPVTPLVLSDVKKFESGAVWLRYKVKK